MDMRGSNRYKYHVDSIKAISSRYMLCFPSHPLPLLTQPLLGEPEEFSLIWALCEGAKGRVFSRFGHK